MSNPNEKRSQEGSKGEATFPLRHLAEVAEEHEMSDEELDESIPKDEVEKEARRETEATWAEMEKEESTNENASKKASSIP